MPTPEHACHPEEHSDEGSVVVSKDFCKLLIVSIVGEWPATRFCNRAQL